MFQTIITRLVEGQHLSESEMTDAMDQIMSGKTTDAQMSAFLTALRMKGETVEEITGAAIVMRKKVQKVDLGDQVTVDTCGTGGDASYSYNISTGAAFVTAAAGIVTVKHGNRSVSGRCGSADVLEALGANIDLSPAQVKRCVRKTGFGFFFAPRFHSAMKYAVPVRKQIGIRTVFNLLGPLCNPAFAKTQVIGVYDASLTEPIARVLAKLGIQRAYVVHGMDGLDEISIGRETKMSMVHKGMVTTRMIEPERFGITRADKKSLEGGDANHNAKILRALFEGQTGPKRDALLINAAAALHVAGAVASMEQGVRRASELIDTGRVMQTLQAYCECTHNQGANDDIG